MDITPKIMYMLCFILSFAGSFATLGRKKDRAIAQGRNIRPIIRPCQN